MVPHAGLEPALPEEAHFECAASTNSANGAIQWLYIGASFMRSIFLRYPTTFAVLGAIVVVEFVRWLQGYESLLF